MIYFQACLDHVHNFLHRFPEAFAKWESHGASTGEHQKYVLAAIKGLVVK